MINIDQYIYPELIMPDFAARTKEEAISSLVSLIFKVNPDFGGFVTEETALKELFAREKMQTTGLGQNMAFPHARIKGWEDLVIAVGISRKGIDFNSLDGQAVNFVFLMISSADAPYLILQAMAAIIRFMSTPGITARLLEKQQGIEIVEEFKKEALKAHEVICARDIMRPVKISVSTDTGLEEASRTMHLHHLDILPVIDKQSRLCGQITCFDIFAYGIPNFFNQLHTVSFVKHIDPFEKYFKIRKDLKVSNIMNTETATISQDATLVEIVFQLTVKNKSKLFIVDDGRLIGELDRFSIIDKILFF